MLTRIIGGLSVLAVLATSQVQAARIPSGMPETMAVERDLAHLEAECQTLQQHLAQLRQAVRSTRQAVDHSIDVVKAIRTTERELETLIDRLKPYLSIPKVRTMARTLVKNLQRIENQVHSVRVKADQCERTVLRPMKKRLGELEQTIRVGESKLAQYSLAAAQWRQHLSKSAAAAHSIPAARNAFEVGSRQAKPATNALLKEVRGVRQMADRVGYQLNRVAQPARAFRKADHSLDEFNDKLNPVDEIIGKLDRVLGKEASFKVPFSKKTLRVSIRDILEKPGELMTVVLKPLEKLADKVLQPVLGKMKLQVQAPRGLEELSLEFGRLPKIHSDLNRLANELQDRLATKLDLRYRSWKAAKPQLRSDLIRKADRIRNAAERRVEATDPVRQRQQPPVRERKLPAMFLGF
jgi:prefoldin subunit 5